MAGFRIPTASQYADSYPELLKRAGARRVDFQYDLTSTDAAHSMEVDAAQTIADIGKTELHVVAQASAALGAASVVTLTYADADGAIHVASTASSTLAAETEFTVYDGTAVASITDFYAPISCTISTVPDGAKTVAVLVAGAGATHCTISALAAASTQAQMIGVGCAWGRSNTADAAYDSKHLVMEYMTPWGQVKWAVAAYVANPNSDTEVRFYESTEAAPATAGTTTVKDFYRVRWAYSTVVAQAGDVLQIGNADSTAIYAAILAAETRWISSRYYVPAVRAVTITSGAAGAVQSNGQSYLARARFWKAGTTAVVTVYCQFQPVGLNAAITQSWSFVDNGEHEVNWCVPLEPKTDVLWTFEDDNAAHEVVHLEVTYIEVPGRLA